MEIIDFNGKVAERARKAIIIKALFEYLVALSVSGAFLAKLLTILNISDSINGIVSSIASVAFLFQIFSFFIANKKINVKKLLIIIQTFSMGLFTFLYIIPFLPLSQTTKAVMFVVIICLAHITKSIFAPLWFKWWTAYIPSHQRGTYYANLQNVSLIFGNVLYVTALAYIIDMFEAANNISGAFIFVIIVSTLFNILHLVCIINIKNCDISPETKQKIPFSEVVKNLITNKGYLSVVAMNSISSFAGPFTTGFISVYCIKELDMNMITIQVFGMIATFVTIISSKSLGKLADRTSYVNAICHGYAALVISYIVIALTVPSLWFLVLIYNIGQSLSSMACGNNPGNLLYKFVHKDYISQALTIKNILCGLVSFTSAILGGMLLDFIQKSGNTFMGFNIYGQQVLAIVSAITMIIAFCIGRFVVAKQKYQYE